MNDSSNAREVAFAEDRFRGKENGDGAFLKFGERSVTDFRFLVSGDVVARVRNNTSVANLLGGRLAMAVLNLFTACFFLVVLFMFNVSLTFVALGVLAIDFTAVWFFNRLRSELARSMQQDVGRESGALMAGLEAIDTLKANGQSGEIHFGSGAICDARFGAARGAEGVYKMLLLTDGEFSLDPTFLPERDVIKMSTDGLLLEGMRRMHENSR